MANNFFFLIDTYNLPFFVEKWEKKKYIYMYEYLFNVVTNFNKRSNISLFLINGATYNAKIQSN